MNFSKSLLKRSFLLALGFVVILLLVKVFEWATAINLAHLGVYPREYFGLIGIFFMPLIHQDAQHLLNNSISFMVIATIFFYTYPKVSGRVFPLVYFLQGVGIWIIGQPGSPHIGASGVVYGILSFVIVSGFLSKNRQFMMASMALIMLYGAFIWGMVPQGGRISWEGHLMGAVIGLGCSIYYRKQYMETSGHDWGEDLESRLRRITREDDD